MVVDPSTQGIDSAVGDDALAQLEETLFDLDFDPRTPAPSEPDVVVPVMNHVRCSIFDLLTN